MNAVYKFYDKVNNWYLVRNWRGFVQVLTFFLAELVLFGAAEGIQKMQWLLYGTIANIVMAAAFKLL